MSDAYEHVAVLVSFIVSLGFAHVLVGVAALIQSPVKVRVSLPHALWVAVAMACLLDLWLGVFEYRTQTRFALGPLLLILTQSAAGYLLAALVMPSGGAAEQLDDLVAFHAQQRKSYLRAFMAFMTLDGVVALVTEGDVRNPSSILAMVVALLVTLAPPAAALWRKERWVQVAAPSLILALLIAYWILLFPAFG